MTIKKEEAIELVADAIDKEIREGRKDESAYTALLTTLGILENASNLEDLDENSRHNVNTLIYKYIKVQANDFVHSSQFEDFK